MNTVYIAHPMTEGKDSFEELKQLATWLCNRRMTVREPSYNLFPNLLASNALKAMNDSDLVIADISSSSHGVGFEIGYAYAMGKQVILIARVSARTHVSKFLSGLLPDVIFYSDMEQLIQNVAQVLNKPVRGNRRANKVARYGVRHSADS